MRDGAQSTTSKIIPLANTREPQAHGRAGSAPAACSGAWGALLTATAERVQELWYIGVLFAGCARVVVGARVAGAGAEVTPASPKINSGVLAFRAAHDCVVLVCGSLSVVCAFPSCSLPCFDAAAGSDADGKTARHIARESPQPPTPQAVQAKGRQAGKTAGPRAGNDGEKAAKWGAHRRVPARCSEWDSAPAGWCSSGSHWSFGLGMFGSRCGRPGTWLCPGWRRSRKGSRLPGLRCFIWEGEVSQFVV